MADPESLVIKIRPDQESLRGFSAMLGEIQKLATANETPTAVCARITFFVRLVAIGRLEGWHIVPVFAAGIATAHVEAAPLIAELLKVLRRGAVTHADLDQLLVSVLSPEKPK